MGVSTAQCEGGWSVPAIAAGVLKGSEGKRGVVLAGWCSIRLCLLQMANTTYIFLVRQLPTYYPGSQGQAELPTCISLFSHNTEFKALTLKCRGMGNRNLLCFSNHHIKT
jgi:hypothetical protein